MQQGGMESSSSREQQMQIVCVRSSPTAGGEEARELESSRSALSLFKEEEEIERKKLEVREKVFSMLGKVEEETKRLAFIRQELEVTADPTRREVESIRKRMDKVNRQLAQASRSGRAVSTRRRSTKCVSRHTTKRANEKAMLVDRLMELVSESERLRMKKLQELSKTIETLY